jgi:RNA polymerase sigma-70 factor, ECF subfamily
LDFLDPKSKSYKDFLQRLKDGDNQAWTYLTNEFGTRLYNYLRRKLPDPQDIEDVLSETMAAAVRAIPTFDGNVTLTTFLFSLANHKIADFWRKRQATSELTELVIDHSQSNASVEFQELLTQIDPLHREVLLMRYHVGLGVDEIAVVLERTYKATESLLSRARMELRKVMDKARLEDDD